MTSSACSLPWPKYDSLRWSKSRSVSCNIWTQSARVLHGCVCLSRICWDQQPALLRKPSPRGMLLCTSLVPFTQHPNRLTHHQRELVVHLAVVGLKVLLVARRLLQRAESILRTDRVPMDGHRGVRLNARKTLHMILLLMRSGPTRRPSPSRCLERCVSIAFVSHRRSHFMTNHVSYTCQCVTNPATNLTKEKRGAFGRTANTRKYKLC